MIPGLSNRVWGFPNSIITKLRYCDVGVITSTLGSVANYVFAANGIFDPDITSVGHQPMYRDTYNNIYNQYTVIGSKITIACTNMATGNTGVVGVHGDDDTSGSATLTTCMEMNNSTWKHLSVSGSGKDTQIITSVFEPLMSFGVDTKDDGASTTAGGSNPTELFTFILYWAANNLGTASMQFAFEIEYTVKFSELITPVQN